MSIVNDESRKLQYLRQSCTQQQLDLGSTEASGCAADGLRALPWQAHADSRRRNQSALRDTSAQSYYFCVVRS